MSEKTSEPKKTKPTSLQAYLAKPLPPFCRGTADCAAFVAGWVNHLAGKEAVKLRPITYGEAKRQALKMEIIGAQALADLNWSRTDSPQDGDIVFYRCEQALGGKAIGIFSEGKAISRMEAPALHLTEEPEILAAWTNR
ncbi:DUF6950 family protein [Roseibacillus ishigakijimensis]|uniref:DUF6950 domain-containing protein n=1 Tax=Roseibacillus ishigakijimensis TaxID=454146 RepID=A0A934RST2_9BACT|nr:hypothetical protein [Roseibacillus ishigakijimensis]MBK1835001.1 hypothetical protein [Roseibacillus ishigakijimensis]